MSSATGGVLAAEPHDTEATGAVAGMSLRRLADHLGAEWCGEAQIFGVTSDSTAVRPGWLFCAVRGARHNGHDHIVEAIRRGAVAILAERWVDAPIPQMRADFTRPLVGVAAALVHGEPSRSLEVAAVTGTNGKTTTSHLAWHALRTGGRRAAMIGTLGTRFDEWWVGGSMTTPPAWQLQETFGEIARRGADCAVMEASSQGLDQDRLAGTRVAVATWLNLTPEHLDYHGTVEQYYAAKARLFDPAMTQQAVVCVDDPWGRRLAAQARVPVTTFGVDRPADVTVRFLGTGLSGTAVELHGLGLDAVVHAPVPGRVNATNIAAAFLIATLLGVPPAQAAEGIADAEPVPGRSQCVDAGQPFLVMVDYAHTPDALAALIEFSRTVSSPGGLVCLVVGCRGGKDRYKRPEMGRAALDADRVTFTSDDPGQEDPAEIVDQMLLGAFGSDHAHVRVDLDRQRAIEQAVAAARPGDVLLVTGRGHEKTRTIGSSRETFDDVAVVRDALAGLGYASGPHDV